MQVALRQQMAEQPLVAQLCHAFVSRAPLALDLKREDLAVEAGVALREHSRQAVAAKLRRRWNCRDFPVRGGLPGVACRRQRENAESQKRREPAARPIRVAVETSQLQESPLFEAPC
jgi:hypothetical protein